jgi:hypothetical protein
MFRIRVIKDHPEIKYTKWGFAIKPKRVSCQVFQWPNGNYSLFVRKPTKHWGRYCEGRMIGAYWDLDKAKKAARKWLSNNH